MNQARGTSVVVSDRWDLTLECIRCYYSGEPSPLSHVTQADSWLYDLLVNFEGYVRFFFLDDCVREDGGVVIWQGDGSMELENPWPTSVDEYLDWVDAQIEFVEWRNLRIADYARRAQI